MRMGVNIRKEEKNWDVGREKCGPWVLSHGTVDLKMGRECGYGKCWWSDEGLLRVSIVECGGCGTREEDCVRVECGFGIKRY